VGILLLLEEIQLKCDMEGRKPYSLHKGLKEEQTAVKKFIV
jgi:hypothetical protein